MIENQLIIEENVEGSITYKLTQEDKNTQAFLSVINKNFNRKNSNEKYLAPRPVVKKNVFKIKKNESSNNESDSSSSNDRSQKTILEMIKDTKSGIPMSKSKNESDYLQNKRKSSISDNNISRKNSVLSNERQIMTRRKSETNPDKTYEKYFKPQLIWDPIANKMIIEKPKFNEATQKMNEEFNRNLETVENLVPHRQHLTSLSFKKLRHTDKWTDEETNFFYKALECFGTDFSFLEIILNPRTRNQIKNKFKKEERENKELVDKALKTFDPTKLNKILAVVNHLRQVEAEQKMKKVKKLKNEKTQFDFKKIFEEIESNQENAPLKQEISEFLKEDSIRSSDEELENESDKTVSVNYEENEIEEEDNEEQIGEFKGCNKDDNKELKVSQLNQENFNMKNFYQSKVSYNSDIQVVREVKNTNNNLNQIIAKQEKKENKSCENERDNSNNNVGDIFMKQLQQFQS